MSYIKQYGKRKKYNGYNKKGKNESFGIFRCHDSLLEQLNIPAENSHI